MQLLATIAALAVAASTAEAASANIYNYCSYDTYLWAVDASRNPSSPTVIKAGGTYSEPYSTPATGGVSLKLSTTQSMVTVTQFEYTLAGGFIWYDGSNVNCAGDACPFVTHGLYMSTSNPSCPTRTCAPGEAPCTGFYTLYNDDVNSLSCDPSADISLYLCSNSASPPAAAAPPAPPAAPPAAAAPPAPAAPAPAAVSVAPAAPPAAPSKIEMEAIHGMPTTLIPHRFTPRAVHNHHRRHHH
jgi:pyruvate/2-oxoglutarate dehydrogenase complex dihydrolipoamide acyltransferase (E2) component